MRRKALTLFSLATVGFYLALAADLAAAAEVKPQWQQEWDKVLEAAKKRREGGCGRRCDCGACIRGVSEKVP